MDDRDVVLELDVGAHGDGYRVQARSSVCGDGVADASLRLEELNAERQVERLRIALLRSAAAVRRRPDPGEKAVLEFGAKLFDGLVTGDVRMLFDSTRQQAAQLDLPVRLVLRIHPPELAVLPWEFMYDRRRDDYLALSTALVRHPEMLEPVRPLRVAPPLRVLGMAASAPGYDRLDIDAEKAHVERAVAGLRRSGRVELEWVAGQTWRALQRALDRGTWHVVHIVGHGGFDRAAGEGVFVLPDEDGGTYLLRAGHLARLLTAHHSLRLVLLNSCESAAGSATDPLSSAAETLLRRGLPAVLAMQFEISDRAAIEFTRSFYDATADGKPIDVAARSARLAVHLAQPDGLEWGTPVLFLRRRDGRIFDMDGPVGAVDRPAAARRPPPTPVSDPPARSPVPATATGAPVSQPARGGPRATTRRRGARSSWPRHRWAVAAAAIFAALAATMTLRAVTGDDWSRAVQVTVPANVEWTPTGVRVRPGQRIALRATGRIATEPGVASGPDGIEQPGSREVDRLAAVPHGALIARVGPAPPAHVGRGAELHVGSGGEVLLGINDGNYQDDTGFFTVLVLVG